MFYSKKDNTNLYIKLMEEIKQINIDYINLRKSKQYKIGMIITNTLGDIKRFNFKNLFKSNKRWVNGLKNKKIKSSNIALDNTLKEPNYFSNERIAIYMAVFGKYDNIPEPYFVPDNCDFYIFTDQEIKEDSVWIKKDLPLELSNFSNIEKNRYLKMHPHKVFNDYNYSIYIDGNIQIITDLTEYINYLNEYGLGIHMHDSRNCVYDEIEAIKKTKKEKKDILEKHKNYLLEDNMPKNYGLLQCSVIVREHNNPICIEIMEAWWNEFSKYSKRDQVSLPHVLYKKNIPINKIGLLGNNLYKNPSFRIKVHN